MLARRQVGVFAVPIIWGPACTRLHTPAYIVLQDELLAVCDELVCLAVADPYGDPLMLAMAQS